MSYHLQIEEHPKYLHAAASGANTAENVLRFLREAYEACLKRQASAVLLEMRFEGPSLDTGSIYSVIAQRSDTGKQMRKIAYVAQPDREVTKSKFAETVAINRGVNVRLFSDVDAARKWLESD
jgi:SpoIIAA-like